MKIYAKRLLTPGGWRADQVVQTEGGVIQAVYSGRDGDRRCEALTPGLFDVHCHGGEGFYTSIPNRERLTLYLNRLARGGVTDILFTTSTLAEYGPSLRLAREAMEAQAVGRLGGAVIRGVHLEGPFLSRLRPGAMEPERMPAPSVQAFEERFAEYADLVRLVTIAPENEGARELAQYLMRRGIRVQAGHTDATYEQAEEAFGWGIDSLCHTFNAARGIHHRNPGVVTAALLNKNVYCEAVCDLKHLHPATILLIYRMKGAERMQAISDSVVVTGLPDGEHVIDGSRYLVVNGTQRVKGGETLSGGACYLDQSVRNLMGLGIPSEDAFRMASRTPAERTGIGQIGRIQAGAACNLAAWDAGWQSEFTVVSGKIYEKE